MGKIKKTKNGNTLLKSYTFNGFVFKPGMKIVWNWSRYNNPHSDEEGRMFVKITKIYLVNEKPAFETDHCISPFLFETFIKSPHQTWDMDIRPYKTRPYSIENNGKILEKGSNHKEIFGTE